MSQGKRYKFNGSTFEVQLGFSASPKLITAVTKADPAVVSIATHGYVEGDVGRIAGISGMTQLNDNLYVVDNPTAGTFELALTDSSGYDTFATGSPAGDGTFDPVTFSEFCELTGVNQQDAGADTVDVSTICSTAKEFVSGLSDSGTLTLDFHYAGLQPVQQALETAKRSGDEMAFRVTLPSDGGHVVMLGVVQQTSFAGQVNGVWTATATIKLTGPKYILS